MQKYLITNSFVAPIYPPETQNTIQLNIQLPNDIIIPNKWKLLNGVFDTYFNSLKTGKIIYIDGYNVSKVSSLMFCNNCESVINSNEPYYYDTIYNGDYTEYYKTCKFYCIECSGHFINNKQYKLRINHFKIYVCDICNNSIDTFYFYHSTINNYDLCEKCGNKQENKQLIETKKLKFIQNNIIDPIGYTFGSLLEWIPIIKIKKFDSELCIKIPDCISYRLVLQHYCQNRFAICDVYTINNLSSFTYLELPCITIKDVINELTKKDSGCVNDTNTNEIDYIDINNEIYIDI